MEFTNKYETDITPTGRIIVEMKEANVVLMLTRLNAIRLRNRLDEHIKEINATSR